MNYETIRQKYCTHCGTPLEPEDKFCIRCGSSTLRKSPEVKIPQWEMPVEEAHEQAAPVKKRVRIIAMIVQIMIVAVAVILGLLLLLPGKEDWIAEKKVEPDAATAEIILDTTEQTYKDEPTQDETIEESVTKPESEKFIGNVTCAGKLVYHPSEAGYYCLHTDEAVVPDCGHSYQQVWLFGQNDGELNDFVDETVSIQGSLYEDESRGIVYIPNAHEISIVEKKNEEVVIKDGSQITATGIVHYSSSPSDLGMEYCYIKVNTPYKYQYGDYTGATCEGETNVYFFSGEEAMPLKAYVGQKVTVSGTFKGGCHGEPFVYNAEVLSSSGVAETLMDGKQTGYPSYDAKIYEYILALTIPDEMKAEYYGSDFYGLNTNILGYARQSAQMILAYTLYDVNKDDVPELIFVQGTNDGYYDIIDLYSLNDGHLAISDWDDSLGYRSHLYILSDGCLVGDGSSGASSGGGELYRIGFDGIAIPLEAYYFDDTFGPSDYMDDIYAYITMDEYVEIRDKWMEKAINLDQLDWIPIV